MTRYARAFGGGWVAAALLPFHLVLYAVWCLDDVERRDGLVRESEALRAAFWVNAAFAAPKNLEKAQRAFETKLNTAPVGVKASDDAVIADAIRIARQHQQEARRGH